MADYKGFPLHLWNTQELGQMLIQAVHCDDRQLVDILREEIKERPPDHSLPSEKGKAIMDPVKLKYDLTLQVRVPSDLLAKARTKSDETGTTLSFVVRQALEKWVKEK